MDISLSIAVPICLFLCVMLYLVVGAAVELRAENEELRRDIQMRS